MMQKSAEITRIEDAYRRRMADGIFAHYSLLIPGELYMAQQREKHILAMLRKQGLTRLDQLKILEVGCGRGSRLQDWLRWGARPENLYGLDLMPELAEEARQLLPLSHISVGSADSINLPDEGFDIVTQFTLFTSVKDAALKACIAAEMQRLTRKDGFMLWYDFRYPNPRNPDVQAIYPGEVQNLFKGCNIHGHTLTLLPPLARALAPFSTSLCRLLEHLPPLRSHYLAVIRK